MVIDTAKENGYVVEAYHGTPRADRVGYVFLPERATSGPMAFFTDNEKIAGNYARDKNDTSLSYDDEYSDYYSQFRVDYNGKSISISDLWNKLSLQEKNEIKRKAEHVTFDWDNDEENIIYKDDNKYGLGNLDDYTIHINGGNYLKALTQSWLEDGNLYNVEEKFLKVLQLAGLNRKVEYKNPNARYEKVYHAMLSINNPFDTNTMYDNNFIKSLTDWYENVDEEMYDKESNGADLWDKNNQTFDSWIERATNDIENNSTHAWTSIPDFVTDYLKSKDYDGIKDSGGKGGGEHHNVWVPFYSEQVKSADPVTYDDNGNIIPLSERFNEEKTDIRYQNDNYKKALTSDEWKKYNNAVISRVDAGLRINDHSMLVECEKGDYSYKLVIYDNTFEENPIKAVYGIGNDSYSSVTIHEVAKVISNLEDKGYARKNVDKTLRNIAKVHSILLGRYNNESGRYSKFLRSNKQSGTDTQDQSDGTGVSEENRKSEITPDIRYQDDMYFLKPDKSIFYEGSKENDKKFARSLKSNFNSAIKTEDVVKSIESIRQIREDYNLTAEERTVKIKDYAGMLANKFINTQKVTSDTAAAVKEELKGVRIKLNEEQREEVIYQYNDFENFRKSFMGMKIYFVKDNGTTLEDLWEKLNGIDAWKFRADENTGNMPIVLYDVLHEQTTMIEKDLEREMQDSFASQIENYVASHPSEVYSTDDIKVDYDDPELSSREILVRALYNASGTLEEANKINNYLDKINSIRNKEKRVNENKKSEDYTTGEKIIKSFVKNVKVTSVAANLRVAVLQPTAYVRAGRVISYESLLKGTKGVFNYKRLSEEAEEYCPICKWKSYGFYDINISNTIEKQLKGTESVKDKINDAVLKRLGAITPGTSVERLVANPDFYEIKTPKAMTIYCECEFHDTKEGSDFIIKNTTAIGEAIAKGLCDYYGVTYAETVSYTYTVTVPGINTKAKAVKLQTEIKKLGYTATIKAIKK